MAEQPKIHGRCELNAPDIRHPSQYPKGAPAAMKLKTRVLRMPGLYTRPRMLMDAETSTPAARPCIARAKKNRPLSRGLMAGTWGHGTGKGFCRAVETLSTGELDGSASARGMLFSGNGV